MNFKCVGWNSEKIMFEYGAIWSENWNENTFLGEMLYSLNKHTSGLLVS